MHEDIANELRISKNGFANRLNKPHYGNYHDVIEISLRLKRDFFSDATIYIKEAGIVVSDLSAAAEISVLNKEINRLNDEINRYKKIIDQSILKS